MDSQRRKEDRIETFLSKYELSLNDDARTDLIMLCNSFYEQGRAELTRMEQALELCPICDHEWRRHDPDDGKCDAGPPCFCGRNLEIMQKYIAELSRKALEAKK